MCIFTSGAQIARKHLAPPIRFAIVGRERLELSTLAGHGPKPCASTNFATCPHTKDSHGSRFTATGTLWCEGLPERSDLIAKTAACPLPLWPSFQRTFIGARYTVGMEHLKLLAERGRRAPQELQTHDWLARQKSRMRIAGNAPVREKERNPLAEEEAIEMDETRAD